MRGRQAGNDQVGVDNVLGVLAGSIDSALLGLDEQAIHEFTSDHVVVPRGFRRDLGINHRAQHFSAVRSARLDLRERNVLCLHRNCPVRSL